MSNTIAEATFSTSNGNHSLANQTAFLIATDGTAQSDAAISIARQLPSGRGRRVEVLTVVDTTPIPWGAVDRSVILDYERGSLEDAKNKASAQLRRLGDKTWQVEVRAGQPAEAIAAMAGELRPRLVIVGLGGHGPAARFFGNETALRLARISSAPILAVGAETRSLPNRILVAMDFSESSIQAARLALEIAAPGATMTLVHVVPWERSQYVPEHWFREHEEHIGAQLKRVGGWLNQDAASRIHQKILYGKPGPALLGCAEDLAADLIVAGTHGRGFWGRVLGGETISKLIRGTRCSVLVFPHASEPDLVRGISNVESVHVLSDATESADRAPSVINDVRQTLLLLPPKKGM